jgi:hypothetical protein
VRESADLFEQIIHGGDIDYEDIMNSPSMYQNLLERLQAHQERGMKEITTSILNCTVGNNKDFFKMAAWNAGVVGKDLP